MLHKKVSLHCILQHILVFLVTLDCNSVYRSAYTNYYIPELCCIALIVLFAYSVVKYGLKKIVVRKCASFFVIYYMIMAIFIVASVPKESVLTFVVRFFIVLPLLILTLCNDICHNKWKLILYAYSNVMVFLAVTSLVFWILGTQFHFLSPNTFIRIYWGGDHIYGGYYGLLFEWQYHILFGMRIMRNQSIFSEGPMYSLCLIIALCIEMFIREKGNGKSIKFGSYSIELRFTTKNRRVLLFTLTTLTTFTTIGMILVIIIFALEYLRHMPKEKVKIIIKIYSSVVVLIIASILSYMVFLDKASSESWSIRTMDYVNGFIAWKKAPIFGNGYGEFMKVNAIAGKTKQGYSNSILAVLSQGGIVLFSVYLSSFIHCGKSVIRQKNTGIISFLIIAVLEFSLTLFPYTFLLLFLIAFFYAIGFMSDYLDIA